MSKGRLVARIAPVPTVTPELEDVLFSLFEDYYDRVPRGVFHRDFREKQWIILLTDSVSNEIKGFSTLMLLDVAAEDIQLVVAFSGDTIIDREYWGEQRLALAWYGLMEKLRVENWPTKLYWFLISKGYRTYLYLPTFFREFYPRHDKATPPFEQKLIDAFGRLKYPDDYDPKTGLVEFQESEGHLKDWVADIPPRRLKDPNVGYFLQQNPGWTRGNELVCVAEFSPENLTNFALRLAGATSRLLKNSSTNMSLVFRKRNTS